MPFLPLLDLSPENGESRDNPWSDNSNLLRSDTSICHKISPRSTTSPILSSNVHFERAADETDTACPSSGEQSPLRGRTLRRVPANNRSTSRMATRRNLSRASTDIWPGDPRERFLSRDFTDEPEEYYDDTLIEPLPFERYRPQSLSEELHRAATFDSSVDLGRFGGHRDIFAMFGFRRLHNKAVELPDKFYQTLVPYLNFDTYKSLRLSCRNWSEAITRARPIILPLGNQLPTEILEKIYSYLEPADFNAARHTCRTWMIGSLEEKLLTGMLHRGGWLGAAQADALRLEPFERRKLSIISKDWLLSKRLATECALAPEWKATGPPLQDNHGIWDNGTIRNSSLSLTSIIDFSELAKDCLSNDEDPPLQFTVSVCQKYLLIAKDRTIHVYSLIPLDGNPPHEYGGCLRPVTSIDCPERVLAVSMDTSSDRLAVAALLQERIGLVCDIEPNGQMLARKLSAKPQTPPFSPPDSNRTLAVINGPVEDLLAWTSGDTPSEQAYQYQADFVDATLGSRSVYGKLCSAHDPPRSVALCPQRRCVAFGNSAGIELHWIDVLSGQDLQRWFPLSSASDFLYFLPNRPSVDSSRKLRVISSAAHPIQTKILDFMYPSRAMWLAKTRSWDLYLSETDTWRLDWSSARRPKTENAIRKAEHYGARPLSDGFSILFTDPSASKLCLGGDGRQGPGTTQLARRFIFRGPSEGLVPYVYTPATELRWGARIVAGYVHDYDLDGVSELWLFTVPPDKFFSAANEKSRGGLVDEEIEEITPLKIYGVPFAKVPGLADLAVDATDGDLTIRAFSVEGRAYTWQIAGSGRTDVVKRAVLKNGSNIALVVEREDEDSVMEDANQFDTWNFDLDGASSRPQHSRSRSHTIDADGDVVMKGGSSVLPSKTQSRDIPDEIHLFDDGQERDNEFEQAGGQFAIHAPPVHGRWSDSDSDWVPQYLAEYPADVEDGGVGIDLMAMTRLELELLGL